MLEPSPGTRDDALPGRRWTCRVLVLTPVLLWTHLLTDRISSSGRGARRTAGRSPSAGDGSGAAGEDGRAGDLRRAVRLSPRPGRGRPLSGPRDPAGPPKQADRNAPARA